jgi:hypothetical protein
VLPLLPVLVLVLPLLPLLPVQLVLPIRTVPVPVLPAGAADQDSACTRVSCRNASHWYTPT